MPSRMFNQFFYSLLGSPVMLCGKATIASTGAPTLVTASGASLGFDSIVRNTTGDYTLTLSKSYPSLRSLHVWFEKADGLPDVHNVVMKSQTVAASTRNIRFQCLGAQNPTIATSVNISAVTASTSLAREASVVSGGTVYNPTTPSSQQAAGGGDATDWNVNIGAGVYYINSVLDKIDPAVDFSVSTASPVCSSGQSVIAAIVAENNSGTFQYNKVLGAAATTGSQAAPSDGDITTALGHANWLRLANITFNRTGDATCTESQLPHISAFSLPTPTTTVGGTATATSTATTSSVEGVAADPAVGVSMYWLAILNNSKV